MSDNGPLSFQRDSLRGVGRRRDFAIRPSTPADIDAVAALERTCFERGVYAEHLWDRKQVAEQLSKPSGIMLIAERNGEIVGYVAGMSLTGVRAHIARVHSIAVAPRARRGGIGSALLKDFVAEAGRRGKRKVLLEVAQAKSGARRVFERAGFDVKRKLRCYYGEGLDGLRMELGLERRSAAAGG